MLVHDVGTGGYSGDEELGAVGVGAGVGHGKKTWFGVSQSEVLVCEFLTVDGFSTSSTVALAGMLVGECWGEYL